MVEAEAPIHGGREGEWGGCEARFAAAGRRRVSSNRGRSSRSVPSFRFAFRIYLLLQASFIVHEPSWFLPKSTFEASNSLGRYKL